MFFTAFTLKTWSHQKKATSQRSTSCPLGSWAMRPVNPPRGSGRHLPFPGERFTPSITETLFPQWLMIPANPGQSGNNHLLKKPLFFYHWYLNMTSQWSKKTISKRNEDMMSYRSCSLPKKLGIETLHVKWHVTKLQNHDGIPWMIRAIFNPNKHISSL